MSRRYKTTWSTWFPFLGVFNLSVTNTHGLFEILFFLFVHFGLVFVSLISNLKYSCEMPFHIFSVSACMTGCDILKWLEEAPCLL